MILMEKKMERNLVPVREQKRKKNELNEIKTDVVSRTKLWLPQVSHKPLLATG